jgi:REP element-mobilizing transposase RayT
MRKNARTPAGVLENGRMSSTYSALYYHFIWGTKNQEPMIDRAWRERLHAFLGGCTKNAEAVPIAIGGVSDHVHMLVSLLPTHKLSEFARDVKRKSSEWIHTEIGSGGFQWQDGYGVFTVSKSAMDDVRAYIAGQEEHHRTRTFREEYIAFLKKHGVEYDERYVW